MSSKDPQKVFELGIPFPWQGSSPTTHGVVASSSPFLLGQRGTLLRFWVNTFLGGPEPLKQRNILLFFSQPPKHQKNITPSIQIYHLILQIYTTTKKQVEKWCPTTFHSNLQETPTEDFHRKKNAITTTRLFIPLRTKSNLSGSSKSPVSHILIGL